MDQQTSSDQSREEEAGVSLQQLSPTVARATKATEAAKSPALVGTGWPCRHMLPQAPSTAAEGR